MMSMGSATGSPSVATISESAAAPLNNSIKATPQPLGRGRPGFFVVGFFSQSSPHSLILLLKLLNRVSLAFSSVLWSAASVSRHPV